ncbi:hypothetical protein EBL85_10550 [Marichromatium sp. AB32]|nr:hypothetical protein EBL85_10550 [Marichromatium sp. AB32]
MSVCDQPRRDETPQPLTGGWQVEAFLHLRALGGSQSDWRLEAGGWRLEAGGWRLEAGGWSERGGRLPAPVAQRPSIFSR